MKKIILACAISIMSCAAYAQVTIGSDNEPVKGALLDLKQNTSALENSAKGMVLPRVNITNLKPVAATGANSLPASIGSPASESWDLDSHIGLVVYNINPCPAGRTVYNETGAQVWDGERWESLIRPAIAAASPAETSGANTWGTAVVRHAAKPNPDYVSETATPGEPENIYEDFYSADFGPAGRWMTTNLAAWKYDGIMHSQSDGNSANGETGRTLTGPNVNSSKAYDAACWCYPGNISGTADLGGTNPMAYNKNPLLGLLYTWSAATAGKGGDTGQKNIYANAGTTVPYMESAFPEGTGTNEQQRIQGICPQGWHLPSDYEWFLLEKEIIRNTTDYSSSATDINPSETSNRNQAGDKLQIPNAGTVGAVAERVAGLGTAMKNICEVNNGVVSNGTSNAIASGGFDILSAGFLQDGTVSRYGISAYFWISSIMDNSSAGFRCVQLSTTTVHRSNSFRYNMMSVRCVKD